MAVDTNRQKLVHLNSATVKEPTGLLNKGEIAVQYATEDPALYIEKADGSLAKFVASDAIDSKIGSAISAATEDFIALKSELTEAVGEVEASIAAVSAVAITAITVNGVSATVGDNAASVDVDSDDVKIGTAITYSGETIATTTNNVTEAIQAVAGKAEANEAAIDELESASHTHDNKDVLDGISSAKVTAWDNAAESAHSHDNKAVLDGITSEKVTAWDNAAESAHSHDNKAVLDALTAEEVAKWNESAHTHFNKSELDLIQSGDVAKWNSLSAASVVVVSARTSELSEGILKTYDVYQGGSVVGSIDIPKDLVVTSGGVVTINDVKYLRLFIANQETPVDIAVTDLVDVYTAGNGVEVSAGNVISAKVVAANGLSVDANGIAMALADGSNAGAMSSSDFTKLAGIENGANVNTIEGVQVNGSDLTPDANKKVNVTITAGTANGTIAVNGADVAVTGLGTAAFSAATAFDEAGAAAAASAAAVSTVIGTAEDTSADTTIKGVIKYVDEKVSETLNAASGDSYVNAVIDGQTVKVSATQSTIDSLALADSSLQGIAEGKGSGAIVDSDKKLDFTSFGIDCGTY